MNKPRCYTCEFCKGYYRYKTDTTGLGRLVSYYCEHKEAAELGSHYTGFIAGSRSGIVTKVSTSPRWCPLRSKNKESGSTPPNNRMAQGALPTR